MILTLIAIAVIAVLILKVIPTLPDPFNWIAGIILVVALISMLLKLTGTSLY